MRSNTLENIFASVAGLSYREPEGSGSGSTGGGFLPPAI